jgi:hypothetical protein
MLRSHHLDVLDAVPGRPQPVRADPLGGLRVAGDHGVQRTVADGVEAGLQPRLSAGDDVVSDRRGVQVAVPGMRRVGVRVAQGRGVRADRAVGEQVAGCSQRAQLPGPGDAALLGRLAPVADDLWPRLGRGQGEEGGEVVGAGDVRPGQLVQQADSQRGGVLAGGSL